jgi:hypothetical protein
MTHEGVLSLGGGEGLGRVILQELVRKNGVVVEVERFARLHSLSIIIKNLNISYSLNWANRARGILRK